MLRSLIIICLLRFTISAFPQVSKSIQINSVPEGSLVTNISGRADFLGNAPLKGVFEFHSEVSVIKLRFCACGFYDTIIKINPQTENVMIRMEKKKFLILPETEKDIIPENEKNLITSLIINYLNDFSLQNARSPVNFMDFAILKRTVDGVSVNTIFEVDPEYLPISRGVKADSVLKDKWGKWLSASMMKLKPEKQLAPGYLKIYFSIISGKKNISIRHIPGVNQSDEFKSETSVYRDDYKEVTTTTYYYETAIDPTFNTSLDQTQKYYELLYEVGNNLQDKTFSLKQSALLSFTNGKLNTVFSTSADINKYSMLTRFLNKK